MKNKQITRIIIQAVLVMVTTFIILEFYQYDTVPYNKYRNHVLSWYFQDNGVKIIPKVDLLPCCSDWIYDGLPRNTMLCCSTQGRAFSKAARQAERLGLLVPAEYTTKYSGMEAVTESYTIEENGVKIIKTRTRYRKRRRKK